MFEQHQMDVQIMKIKRCLKMGFNMKIKAASGLLVCHTLHGEVMQPKVAILSLLLFTKTFFSHHRLTST